MRTLLFITMCTALSAQTAMSLAEAVQQARRDYPSIRISQEQVNAASAAINLARTAFLPHIDGIAQLNRGTRNNVFGQMLPQSVIPSMSGPVLGTNDLTNVWGSAVGLLVSWEPYDFGLRQANVDVANAARLRAQAGVIRTQFEVAALTADAYLTVVAAQQTVKAANAGLDRAKVLEQITGALTRNELRPGADLSRSQAERAIAETQVIQAEQAVAIAQATLAQMLGEKIAVAQGSLLDLLAEMPATVAQHPVILEQNAAIEEVKARENVLSRSYFPKINLQAAEYARGTGARPDGSIGGFASGLGPNFQNWALGATVTFPIMDFKPLREKKQIEAHNEQAESARAEKLTRELNGQLERARAQFEGARRIAQMTPIERKSAQDTLDQATARYRAGLNTLVEVAEAQRLVLQTEIDDALARLNVWRAALGIAAAQGDLEPFLKLAGSK